MPKERGFFTFDGPNGVGKTTVLKLVAEELDCSIMRVTTPDCLKPIRNGLKNMGADLVHYSLLNLWMDRITMRRILKRGELVLEDRSWLSTLYSHERQNISPLWMKLGKKIASQCLVPNLAFIINSDNEVRKSRLQRRGYMDKVDIASLDINDETALGYQRWANILGWNSQIVDNSHMEEIEARDFILHRIKSVL